MGKLIDGETPQIMTEAEIAAAQTEKEKKEAAENVNFSWKPADLPPVVLEESQVQPPVKLQGTKNNSLLGVRTALLGIASIVGGYFTNPKNYFEAMSSAKPDIKETIYSNILDEKDLIYSTSCYEHSGHKKPNRPNENIKNLESIINESYLEDIVNSPINSLTKKPDYENYNNSLIDLELNYLKPYLDRDNLPDQNDLLIPDKLSYTKPIKGEKNKQPI